MSKLLPPRDSEVDIIDVVGEDITESEKISDDELLSITSEFAGIENAETKIKVYQVVPNKGSLAWLFDCVPSELPIFARVRDDYGGGEYVARVYVERKLRRQHKFAIVVPQHQKVQKQGGELSDLLRAMQEQQALMFAQLKEVMMQTRGVPATPTNPMEMMASMMGMMASMKEFIAPRDETGSVLKAIEVVKDLLPDRSGGESGIFDVVKELIKSPALESAISSLRQPVATAPSVQLSPPHPQTVTPQIPQEETMSLQDAFIRAKITELVHAAKRGSDPELYAELILDQLPEAVVREHLLASDAIDRAALLVPAVEQFRDWFVELQSVTRLMLTATESDAPENSLPVVTPKP